MDSLEIEIENVNSISINGQCDPGSSIVFLETLDDGTIINHFLTPDSEDSTAFQNDTVITISKCSDDNKKIYINIKKY